MGSTNDRIRRNGNATHKNQRGESIRAKNEIRRTEVMSMDVKRYSGRKTKVTWKASGL